MLRRLFYLAFALALAAAIGSLAWAWHPLPIAEPVRVRVSPGTGLAEATRLAAQATGIAPWPLRLLANWRTQPQHLRTGFYDLTPGMTPLDIIRKFDRGDVVLSQITIVEGWTLAQMRLALANSGAVQNDSTGLSDTQLMARIGSPSEKPEGGFMPDTYRFALGASDLAVFKLAHQAMRRALEEAWARRDADLPLKTPEDALTLASIIEKETGVAEDRPKIAAVFVNRLRIGMKLQTDPTVIYGLGDRFDGTLRKRDLLADTPYNTYVHEGLPPTPIALPGHASIKAALHPANIRALYFVSRGDGSSEFSETLVDHHRAVDRYQRKS